VLVLCFLVLEIGDGGGGVPISGAYRGGVSDGLGVLVVRRLLPWLLCSPKLFCQWLLLPLYNGSGDWFWLLELRRWLWCVLCVLGDFLCLMVVVIGGDEEVMCLSSYW
jgi:hypothetical protein